MRTLRLAILSGAVTGLVGLATLTPSSAYPVADFSRPAYQTMDYFAPTGGEPLATPIFYDPSCRTVRQRSGNVVIECDDGYIG